MVQKLTREYAHHGMSLECDIYTDNDYPEDAPVFLYFHPGGLVDWGRNVIAPWLVQSCVQRKWPLISPSYRLLPQTGANGLLEDVSAAYEFAQNWDTSSPGVKRHVIAGGASGGESPQPSISTHLKASFLTPESRILRRRSHRPSLQPPPVALLSIQGINTFRHPFFNSSTLLTPEPIPDSDMEDIISGPIQIGTTPVSDPSAFHTDKILPDASKNPHYKPPSPPPTAPQDNSEPNRGMLYDYYTYRNAWLDLVGSIDPGYDWARDSAAKERAEKWPPTVIFHGNQDFDVPVGVSQFMYEKFGPAKVDLFIANDQPHLFELGSFIEDTDSGMVAVRQAVARLDVLVAKAYNGNKTS
ncbi:hypothetical protein PT974_02210 [Cladobotryum mycophilum]|uniref:Uncharacterized protein n=1 Tax=Cladobotryum mycophilum TaxID=491253 RepID=A0ABR0SXF3_9HYPO